MKNTVIKELLNLNIKRTKEEKRACRVAFLSIMLFHIGILFDLIKNKSTNLSTYFALSFAITAVCFFLLISIRIYEFFIYINANYIWYIIKDTDTLFTISKKCLPECNPWRTMKIIEVKNNITEEVYPGEKILIPVKNSI